MRIMRKGFTLVELLIVIVVIGVLAAMMMLSSTEAVSSAKAAKIISNLTNVKKAVLAWHLDNLDKIKTTGTIDDVGRVILNNSAQPIQHLKIEDLGIDKYLSSTNGVTFNNSKRSSAHGDNTRLFPGCYGIYDAGEPRTIWYVGYGFADGEDAVRDKVAAKARTLGLVFTDEGDPYDTIKIVNDNAGKAEDQWRINGRHFVWLQVLSM